MYNKNSFIQQQKLNYYYELQNASDYFKKIINHQDIDRDNNFMEQDQIGEITNDIDLEEVYRDVMERENTMVYTSYDDINFDKIEYSAEYLEKGISRRRH